MGLRGPAQDGVLAALLGRRAEPAALAPARTAVTRRAPSQFGGVAEGSGAAPVALGQSECRPGERRPQAAGATWEPSHAGLSRPRRTRPHQS